MKMITLASAFALAVSPAWAAATSEITGPTEVGTTTMPAGQYYVTEQISHKTFDLTVTQKGNMILAPAPTGLQVVMTPSAVPAVPSAVATPVAPAAPAALPAITAAPATAQPSTVDAAAGAVKGLVKQGVQKGMNELLKQQGPLKNLLK